MNVDLSHDYFGFAVMYAKFYSNNPRNFINCFLKFNSVRMVCDEVVRTLKRDGTFKELKGDFSQYANKQKIEEKWKPVLAEILLIIYSIVRPDTAEDAE